MIIEDNSAQVVAHDNGAVVAGTGRAAYGYARGGRALPLHVQPLDIYFVRLRIRDADKFIRIDSTTGVRVVLQGGP